MTTKWLIFPSWSAPPPGPVPLPFPPSALPAAAAAAIASTSAPTANHRGNLIIPPLVRRTVGAEHTPARLDRAKRAGAGYVSVYSGPAPPSGGVRRPPLAVIAPHWTQFEGVTMTCTLPASSGPTS